MCLSRECGILAAKQAAQPVYVPNNPHPFISLVAESDEEMVKVLNRFLATGSSANFGEEMLALLLKFHAEAHVIGQQEWHNAGQTMARARANQVVRLGKVFRNPRTMEDIYVPPEAMFLDKFVRDLMAQDSRYFKEGEWEPDQILGRMRMYQGKLRGTEGFGVLDASPRESRWGWRLGGAEEHCLDCPFLAGLTPIPAEDWATTPGQCDTICIFNCTCELYEVESGVVTAPPIMRVAA